MQQEIKKQLAEGNWAVRNYKQLQEKYPDQWVVIRNQKVIAHGKDADKYPKDFSMFITSGAEIF